ncbi:MAG TPA: nuclease-related domain-containing protein [Chthoniobacterales bacterium]
MAEQQGRAGQRARELARKRHLAQLKYAPVFALCLVGAASFPFWAGKPGGVLFLLPALLLMRFAFGWLKGRLAQRRAEVKRAVRGAKGEEQVANLLEQLGEGYAVFHDLPSPYGNIDHLVLSRTQGLFLLETKAHGGRVQRVGSALLVNGKPPEKDFVAQVHRNRAWLRDALQQRLGVGVAVHGLLVFAHAFVENVGSVQGVQVLPSRFLLGTLQKAKGGTPPLLWEKRQVLAELCSGEPSPLTPGEGEAFGIDTLAQAPEPGPTGLPPSPTAAHTFQRLRTRPAPNT